MGLGPVVLDPQHRERLREALRRTESGIKRGQELSDTLDSIEDEVIRYDLVELLFRAQDVLKLKEPDWLKAVMIVQERMLNE